MPPLQATGFIFCCSEFSLCQIEQACWIFNTRCCPAGLPRPSGLISTANTVARRLTPNQTTLHTTAARSCCLSDCPLGLCLASVFPRCLTTSGQWFSCPERCSALQQVCAALSGTGRRKEAAALTGCPLMAFWFSAWTERAVVLPRGNKEIWYCADGASRVQRRHFTYAGLEAF